MLVLRIHRENKIYNHDKPIWYTGEWIHKFWSWSG